MSQRTEALIVAHFSILEGPRIERHKKHNLVDILVLAICGVLSGAEGWDAIEEFHRYVKARVYGEDWGGDLAPDRNGGDFGE